MPHCFLPIPFVSSNHIKTCRKFSSITFGRSVSRKILTPLNWRIISLPMVACHKDSFKFLDHVHFDSSGLVPVITQQHDTGEVLMLAWMNREALNITIKEGRVCYYSRSRKKLWRKGEFSGQVQWLKEVFLDCDADAILLKVEQRGVACHTGRRSCFFHRFSGDDWEVILPVEKSPETLYGSNE